MKKLVSNKKEGREQARVLARAASKALVQNASSNREPANSQIFKSYLPTEHEPWKTNPQHMCRELVGMRSMTRCFARLLERSVT
jgi:hypothetical protein